jgi:NADH-quinone oxidoreductase subunit N
MNELVAAYGLIAPEIVLVVGAMALLMLGVFRPESDREAETIGWLAIGVLGLAAWLVLNQPAGKQALFDGAFVVDGFARFMKLLTFVATAGALFLSFDYMRETRSHKFEYPVLVLLATAGMGMMISAGDLIALYLGLELQSLALYVVAAIRRDDVRSSEAGLKYFVLGALSSGMLLYGASLIYGFTGATTFTAIAAAAKASGAGQDIGLIIGLVFLLVGLAFKISAVPFHMWTPDVYEGAPTPVTALFAVAPKIAAVSLLVSVLMGPFKPLFDQWQQIIVVASVLSMALGAFAALRQQNIKRLMAYSSIGNVGYILLGLASGSEKGIQAVVFYLAIYLVMTLGVFATILLMKRRGVMVEGVDDLAGLGRTHPMMAFALLLFMFSLAGIPPLAGFWGKLYIFMAAVEAKLYWPAVLGVLASVVASYYYLRIVKVMYFDEPGEALDQPVFGVNRVVAFAAAIIVAVFSLAPQPLSVAAAAAAKGLFP